MHAQGLTEERPFAVEVYRTEGALFVHVLPKTWRQTFLLAKPLLLVTAFPISVLCLLHTMAAWENLLLEDFLFMAGLLLFTTGGIFGLAAMLASEQFLLRIDGRNLRKQGWVLHPFLSACLTETLPRPERIEFSREGQTLLFSGDEPSDYGHAGLGLKLRPRESDWVREAVERFEAEVPRISGETKPETEESTFRTLRTKTFRGHPLVRLENPAERNAGRGPVPSEKTTCPILRCPRCDTVVPEDHLVLENAWAKCPDCRHLFEVGDLVRKGERPARSRFELREHDGGLHLHQRRRIAGLPLLFLLLLFALDGAFWAVYLGILRTNPETTLHEIGILNPEMPIYRAARMYLIVHGLAFFVALWSLLEERFVDFGSEEVRFRIRLPGFSWSRTVPRSRVGGFGMDLWSALCGGGFYLPYDRRRFNIAANQDDRDWLLPEIGAWMLRHPPGDQFSPDSHLHDDRETEIFEREISERFPLSGIAVQEREVRLHCPDCGTRLDSRRIDLPRRHADCDACSASFPLEKARRFALELFEEIPESDRLVVTETPKEFRIDFLPMKEEKRGLPGMIVQGLVALLCGVILLFPLSMFAVLLGVSVLRLFQQPDFALFVLTFVTLILMLPSLALFGLLPLMILAQAYDDLRSRGASWSSRVGRDRFEVTIRYKNKTRTISVSPEEILEIRTGRPVTTFWRSMDPSPVLGRFPSVLCSDGPKRIELVLKGGRIEYLPRVPESKKDRKKTAWLANRWNEALAMRDVTKSDGE